MAKLLQHSSIFISLYKQIPKNTLTSGRWNELYSQQIISLQVYACILSVLHTFLLH